MIYIKIFGIQRTSTTYTARLINDNVNKVFLFSNEFGSKHGKFKEAVEIKKWVDSKIEDCVGIEDYRCKKLKKFRFDLFEASGEIYPFIVIKNPYSWYQSIKSWTCPMRKDRFDFDKWYKGYNDLYRNWKELLENPWRPYGEGKIVSYEELLEDPMKLLNFIAKRYKVKLKNNITIPKQVTGSNKFTEERKRFYLQNGNFGLTNKLIRQITEIVDWELMEFYGYKRMVI